MDIETENRELAVWHLERARSVAKLDVIPDRSKDDDTVYMPDGSLYGDIEDELSDMQYHLTLANLTLTAIGTSDEELKALRAKSYELNTPHRERMKEMGRMKQVRENFDL